MTERSKEVALAECEMWVACLRVASSEGDVDGFFTDEKTSLIRLFPSQDAARNFAQEEQARLGAPDVKGVAVRVTVLVTRRD